MWINFEQSPTEDETISNTFSARGLYRISSDNDVSWNFLHNILVSHELWFYYI